jgi:hypothetical protein
LVVDDKLPITSREGVFGREADHAADLFSRMIFARSSLDLDKLGVDVVTLAFDATPLRALTLLFIRGMSSLE